MAATISSEDPPGRDQGWIWFELDRLDSFSALHGAARTVRVMEALMRIAESPLDSYPGSPVPGAPSHLFRYVIDAGARIDFLVTHPIVRNGLKLIAVTAPLR